MPDAIDEDEVDDLFDEVGKEPDEGDDDGGDGDGDAEPSGEPEVEGVQRRRRPRDIGPGHRVEVTLEMQRKGEQRPRTASARGIKIQLGDCHGDDNINLGDTSLRVDEAAILAGDDGPYVVSLNSDKAPKLNGAPLAFRIPEPLHEGDRLEIRGTQAVVKKLVHAAAGDAQYMGIKMIDKCAQCGGPMPLNGPLLEWHCNNCQQTTPVEPDYWTTALDGLFEEYGEEKGEYMLAFETSTSFATERPRCLKCKATLPVDDVPIGTRGNIFCPGCGAANTTAPAPDWMRGACPSAVQFYNAEIEGGADPAAMATPQAAKPVMLSCPSCNGALKITAESERTTTCQFCSTDVYLPDDLWKRLHPVRIAGMWYVRFAGLAPEERETAREVRRIFERGKAKLEKQKRRDADAAAKAAAAARAPADTAAPPPKRAEKRVRAEGGRRSLPGKRLQWIAAIAAIAVGFVWVWYSVQDAPDTEGPGWSRVELFPVGTTVNGVGFSMNAPFQFTVSQPTPQSTITWSSESYGLVVDVSAVAAIPPDGFQAAAMLGEGLKSYSGTAWNDAVGYSGQYRDTAHTAVAAVAFRAKTTPVPMAVPGKAEAVMARPILMCRAIWRRSVAFDDVDALGDYLQKICDGLRVP
jgi:hypothetical protein